MQDVTRTRTKARTRTNALPRAKALTASAIVATIAAWAGWHALQERQRVGALILNETLPVHSKWWRERAKRKGELLYVAIGDSAAQGIGASAPHRGYVGILGRDIRRLTGRSVRTVNLSVSGATVGDAVGVQLPRLAKLQPDVVTVAIGANDIPRFDAAEFERDLRTVYSALPSHAVVGEVPYFYLPHNEARVSQANAIVHRIADELGLRVAPVHATTRRRGMLGALTLFAMDFFHPNDRGYRDWADAFEPELTAELAGRFPKADPKADPKSDPAADAAT